ncbi:uncharacterized protein LOC141491525 [Macrotis lagotis]|uniref:uncharacterized protein LOC141491525 n=1 Tax=Macrotis lagotis TaxID=92651 RepID=UPI003D694A72
MNKSSIHGYTGPVRRRGRSFPTTARPAHQRQAARPRGPARPGWGRTRGGPGPPAPGSQSGFDTASAQQAAEAGPGREGQVRLGPGSLAAAVFGPEPPPATRKLAHAAALTFPTRHRRQETASGPRAKGAGLLPGPRRAAASPAGCVVAPVPKGEAAGSGGRLPRPSRSRRSPPAARRNSCRGALPGLGRQPEPRPRGVARGTVASNRYLRPPSRALTAGRDTLPLFPGRKQPEFFGALGMANLKI